MKLRDYQREALDALYAYWRNDGGNGLIVLPTGSGKSLVIAAICQEILADYKTLRIGIVSHVKELLAQNYKELLGHWPGAPVGIHSAGIGKRDRHNQIMVMGIQSVWNKVDHVGAFDLILIDEVHLVSKNANTMYGKFLARLREKTSDMRMVGLSATPFRLDSGRLDRGPDKLFDKIVYEANVRDLIEQKYLCNLMSKATATILDTSGVGVRGGEFIPGELEDAIDKDWITKSAAKEIVAFGANRKSWAVFCSGVRHAEHMRDAIRALGIRCESVTGETPKGDRDAWIQQFKNGVIQCVTSVGILGTGFNHPGIDLIGLCRPTKSAGLFLQQVGRGLRNARGKRNCLVLDFAGLTKEHGPIDLITVTRVGKDKKKGEALAKECPQCASLIPLGCQTCPDCGYEFPRDETPTHAATADVTRPILSQAKPELVVVTGVRYYKHMKEDSRPSLRVEYDCGVFLIYKEWITIEHTGPAWERARQWWQIASNGTPMPRTVDEALTRKNELTAPSHIQVRPDGKYFRVCGRRFHTVISRRTVSSTHPGHKLGEVDPF